MVDLLIYGVRLTRGKAQKSWLCYYLAGGACATLKRVPLAPVKVLVAFTHWPVPMKEQDDEKVAGPLMAMVPVAAAVTTEAPAMIRIGVTSLPTFRSRPWVAATCCSANDLGQGLGLAPFFMAAPSCWAGQGGTSVHALSTRMLVGKATFTVAGSVCSGVET